MSVHVWIEWLICVPLLTYIFAHKASEGNISRSATLAVASMFLCIFFGFLMSFTAILWASIMCLIMSVLSYLVLVFVAVYGDDYRVSQEDYGLNRRTDYMDVDFLTKVRGNTR